MITQLIVMALLMPLGFAAFKRFRPAAVAPARGKAVPAQRLG